MNKKLILASFVLVAFLGLAGCGRTGFIQGELVLEEGPSADGEVSNPDLAGVYGGRYRSGDGRGH
ncbi:hypothetical protein ES703_14973 [subsurface metagenome]|nr:hypothetical protein [bacterium]